MGLSLLFSEPYFLGLFSSKREDGTFLCLRINKGCAHHASTFSLVSKISDNLIDFKLHHVPP
jgi:hypothetical protein